MIVWNKLLKITSTIFCQVINSASLILNNIQNSFSYFTISRTCHITLPYPVQNHSWGMKTELARGKTGLACLVQCLEVTFFHLLVHNHHLQNYPEYFHLGWCNLPIPVQTKTHILELPNTWTTNKHEKYNYLLSVLNRKKRKKWAECSE